MKKLNLGCGMDYREGYINIDKNPNLKTDMCINFECPMCLYGIKDNSIEEVLLFDVIEHIGDLFGLMGEVWRVCKKDAIVHIKVPYWSHYLSVIDPTHVRFFHEGTFQFFSKKFYEDQKDKQTTQIPIDFDFDIESIEYIPDEQYKDMNKEELSLYKETQINVIQQLYVKLKVIK